MRAISRLSAPDAYCKIVSLARLSAGGRILAGGPLLGSKRFVFLSH